jgi:hypothetical protein
MKRLMKANLEELESIERDARVSDFKADVHGEDVAN